MPTQEWPLLASLLAGNPDLSSFSPAFISALAEQLDEALRDERPDRLAGLAQQLLEWHKWLLRHAPPAVRAALRTEQDSDVTWAAMLGKAGLAAELVAQARSHRVDDAFLGLLEDRRFQPYLAALRHKPQTGVELAETCQETPETVSRKLKYLREHGFISSVSNGRHMVHRLGAAVKAALDQTEPPKKPAEPSNIAELFPVSDGFKARKHFDKAA
jgi:DNA-binding transcriptional ArsR family regulator